MAEALSKVPDPEPAPELQLPDSITVTATPEMRLSPNDIRRLREQTGRTFAELSGDEADEADRMQTMTWLQLRRQGHDVRWADCGDIAVEFQVEEPDPTKTEP